MPPAFIAACAASEQRKSISRPASEYVNARYGFALAKASVERDSACCLPEVSH